MWNYHTYKVSLVVNNNRFLLKDEKKVDIRNMWITFYLIHRFFVRFYTCKQCVIRKKCGTDVEILTQLVIFMILLPWFKVKSLAWLRQSPPSRNQRGILPGHLSVTLTAFATILAPLVTPSLMKLLAGQFVPLDFWSMMLSISNIFILPIVAGLMFNSSAYGKVGNKALTIQVVVYTLGYWICRAYITATTEASVGIKTPLMMPKSIRKVMSIAQKASIILLPLCFHDTFGCFG